jgi:hypothetical protein
MNKNCSELDSNFEKPNEVGSSASSCSACLRFDNLVGIHYPKKMKKDALNLLTTLISGQHYLRDHHQSSQYLEGQLSHHVSVCRGVDGSSGSLEQHPKESSHGDVCRVAVDNSFFCPVGCAKTLAPTHCASSKDSASHTPSPEDSSTPCRIYLPRLSPSLSSKSGTVSSSHGGGGPEGGDSEGPLCLAGFELETHGATLSERLSHGDVCRSMRYGSNEFVCPKGCLSSANQPWCVVKELGSQAVPCRVKGRVDDGADHNGSVGGLSGRPLISQPPNSIAADASLALRSHLQQQQQQQQQALSAAGDNNGWALHDSSSRRSNEQDRGSLRAILPRASRIGLAEEAQVLLYA